MDFIAGGDFRTLLNNSGVLKEEHARFYISEMFVSVNELHKLGYIHRDLKPEVDHSILFVSFSIVDTDTSFDCLQNFLIDPSGHIKLTDFGLAAGALNPGKIEHLKHKVSSSSSHSHSLSLSLPPPVTDSLVVCFRSWTK